MKIDIVDVFARAAKITWKYKILWIFGILASCGRRSGSSSNSSSRNNTGNNPLSSEMMRQAEAFFQRMETWFQQNTWILYALFAFVFIAIVLQIFFSLVGTAGLARGVFHIENGAASLRFGELFGESLDYFWKLLGAAFIIWLPFLIILILSMFVFLLPVIRGGASEASMAGGLVLFLFGLCCCILPISLAVSLYHVQVKRSIMLEEMGVFTALARGWQVLSQNIAALLIIGVVIFIASLIINILVSLPVLLIVLPLMMTLVQGNLTSWQPFIAVGAFLICYSPVAWFINGFLMTYTESVWTLAYLSAVKSKDTAPVFIEANA